MYVKHISLELLIVFVLEFYISGIFNCMTVFSEIESNYCLNELMGEVKQNQNACNLTEDCLRKMFAPGQLDHYLQRQIFYTIVASKVDFHIRFLKKRTLIF